MRYRVLIAGDLHKRMKDITTIRGYVEGCRRVQSDLMDIIKNDGITHFISLGDWFDSGYGSDVAAALSHTDIDREMSKLLNGNFYGLIGNHIRIRMDSNPELFLIQPHPVYKSRHSVTRQEQIIRTPKDLILNGVQFHFMHWNKDAESAYAYKALLNKDCRFHIGLYHSEYVIPSAMLHNMGMNIVNDSSAISTALERIDIAIVGHIHKPLGSFTINKNDGSATTMIVPGSLTNTDAGEISRHSFIDMPVIDIDDDGNVSLSYKRLDLHTDNLCFMKKAVSADMREKLKSLRGNNKETLYGELEASTFVGESSGFISLNSFMLQQGYTPGDKSLIRNVINSPDDVDKLVSIYKEDTTCPDM
jgi:predicted phosphodiesterase